MIEPKLVEEICESEMLYLVLVSMISSDNILTKEDAEKSLVEADEFEEATKKADIPDDKREFIMEHLKKAREILNADIERFEEEQKKQVG